MGPLGSFLKILSFGGDVWPTKYLTAKIFLMKHGDKRR